MYKRSLLLLTMLALWLTPSTYAQAFFSDSLSISRKASHVIDYYFEHISGQNELYNGPRYEIMPPPNKGNFYFGDHVYCTPATVFYSNTWYRNIPVLYDVYHDQMITYTGDNFLVLDHNKTHDINLLEHQFKYMDQAGISPGYYEVLYNGKSQVLLKRTKVINEEIVSQREVETIVVDKDQLYLKKGNAFIPVESKSSIFTIFSDRKKEIKQYLHDQKLNFNQDRTATIVLIAGYYDQLSK